jgi:hypothetical protein
MSWLRLQIPGITSHIFILYVFRVFEHLKMLWMGIWVHPYTVIPTEVGQVKFEFLKYYGMTETK